MKQAFAFALRDLRGSKAGLRLLALCLFLGVATLAGIGSLSSAILGNLSERGQVILGGDIQMETAQRTASPEERAAFDAVGKTSETIRMRATKRPGAAAIWRRTLIDLKIARCCRSPGLNKDRDRSRAGKCWAWPRKAVLLLEQCRPSQLIQQTLTSCWWARFKFKARQFEVRTAAIGFQITHKG